MSNFSSFVPATDPDRVGDIVTLATSPPTGYLVCDGALLSRETYAELFNVIGTTFDKSTDTDDTLFRLPDLRGTFLRGVDASAGRDSYVATREDVNGQVVGDVVGSYEVNRIGLHYHGSLPQQVYRGSSPVNYYSYILTNTDENGSISEVLCPPNINFLFCIRAW